MKIQTEATKIQVDTSAKNRQDPIGLKAGSGDGRSGTHPSWCLWTSMDSNAFSDLSWLPGDSDPATSQYYCW